MADPDMNDFEPIPGFENHSPDMTMMFRRKATPAQKDAEELNQAVSEGNIGKAREMLAARPELINGKDREGMTALHAAADKEATGIANFLLDQGAEVNAQDKRGRTPLIIAAERSCESGDTSMITLLIHKGGADPNIGDNTDRVAKVIPLSQQKPEIAAVFDEAVRQREASQIARPCRDGVTHVIKVFKPLVLKS